MFFSFPRPVKTSGNSLWICSTWVDTAATFMPTFNIPSFVAVCLSNSGTPWPLTTINSAFSLPFPALTSRWNVPFVSSGFFEAYEYVRLFCGATLDVRLIFLALSVSNVYSSTMLLYAPQSANMCNLTPPTTTSSKSSAFTMFIPIRNAYSCEPLSDWSPYVYFCPSTLIELTCLVLHTFAK